MIPKIIHYCWLSNDPIPKDMVVYMESWKKNLPEYEFVKWDFSRFPKEQSLWVKQAFEKKKYAFAADYIRLYALYTMGGIYLDMDVEVLKSYNPLLSLPAMFCYEANGCTIEAATMGAEKGSKWIKACLDYYKDKPFVNEDGTLNMIPIPQIMKTIFSNKYRIVEINGADIIPSNCVPVLSSDYFSPRSYATGLLKITDNTYSIHQFSGSWLPWYVKVERTICQILGIRYRDILNRYINHKNQKLS